MQTGITVPANERAAHPSSWQGNLRWLIACLCWGEHRFRGLLKRQKTGAAKYSFAVKKGMSSLWCLFKTFLQAPLPHLPSPPPCSLCLRLRCSQIMFPESNLTSGVESFSSLLAIIHRAHQPSWNINWKGKKAVRHFLTDQFDFRQRQKGARVMYADVSRYPVSNICISYRCELHFSWPKSPSGMQSELLLAGSSLVF